MGVDQELAVIVQLVQEAYPELPMVTNVSQWLSGQYDRPGIFVQTKLLKEQGHTLTSTKVVSQAIILLHYEKQNDQYIPLSSSPLLEVLRRNKYSYRLGETGLFIHIDQTTLQISIPDKDRTEITFEFEYLVPVHREMAEKINQFEVEREWED